VRESDNGGLRDSRLRNKEFREETRGNPGQYGTFTRFPLPASLVLGPGGLRTTTPFVGTNRLWPVNILLTRCATNPQRWQEFLGLGLANLGTAGHSRGRSFIITFPCRLKRSCDDSTK
jgi:hypothetical protein